VKRFDDHRSAVEQDRELDDMLRKAMMDETPDVSPLLARVRREMAPVAASRTRATPAFVLSAVAAVLLIVVISGAFVIQSRRNSALAVDAACDHFDELVQPSDKKWATAPADVDAYVREHFPQRRDIVGALTPRGASFQKLASCRLLSARFAHFVYRSGDREISIFVRISQPYEDRVRRVDYFDRRLQLQVASFITPRYEGLVVAAAPSAATREIANTLAARL
jgi:hypothetical protein